MSIQARTNVVYPVYHSNKRTEFRIDPAVYLNSFRLAKIRPAVSGAVAEGEYQYMNGVGSLVKNITLYHDNIPIDGCRNASEWLCFEELRNTNDANSDVMSGLTHTRAGFKVGAFTASGVQSSKFVNGSQIVRAISGAEIEGMLPLDRCLKFLQGTPMINARPLELRLVVEWETDKTKVFKTQIPTNYGMNEPVLFVDEVVRGAEQMKNDYVVSYRSLENDRVVVGNVANGIKQQVNLKVNGFNNKLVGRVLFVNQLSSSSSKIIQGSQAQRDEQMNVRLNNKSIFSGEGINDANKKMDYCVKTFGGLNVPQGVQFWDLENTLNLMEGQDTAYLQGLVSYGACRLDSRVNDLEIEYKRTGESGISNNNGTDPFTIGVYAEVLKQMSVKGNNVIVSNA